MATFSDLMRLKLELDSREFSSGLDKAGKDAKDTFDDIGDDAEGTASRFSGIGGKMGRALVAGFAAVGAGALIMQGIADALEARQGQHRIQAAFGLTADEAERFGKIAGDVYAAGWGEGLTEVQNAVAATARKLEIESSDALAGVTSQILAVSQTWGEDFEAVVRSTNQLLQNDLAPNAQAALDLIVAAFQEGGNEAGDLLDTIDEYSQHWSALGFSGEDALNQVISGFQNGQRDADKMADAVKEMRVRITENTDQVRDALENIGLDADRVVAAFIQGGPVAREAFLEVIEALQQGQARGDDTADAVALIGTQFEDLGPRALESLGAVDGALDTTRGKAQELADTLSQDNEFEELKRDGEAALRTIGEGALGLKDVFLPMLQDSDELAEKFGKVDESAREADASSVLLAQHLKGATDDWRSAIENAVLLAAQQRQLDHDTLIASEAMRDEARAADHVATVLGQTAEATEELEDATDDLREAYEELIGEIDDRQAYLNLRDAIDDTVATLNDQETSARDAEQATLNLKEEVLRYAQALDLPPEVATDILAIIDEGSFTEVERRLASLERLRVTRVAVQQVSSGSSRSTFVPSAPRTGGTTHKFGAEGAVVNRRTDNVTLGEAGPEAVVPLDKVPGNAPIESILGDGSPAPSHVTVPVTINVKGELIDERTIRRLYDAAPDAFAQAVRRANAHANRFNP